MRVMTYNIRTGGVDRGQGSRLDAIAQVITREVPDVLAVQELRDFHRNGERLRRFADAVGMRPFLAPSWFGQPVGVFVRPPARIRATRAVRWRLHHAAAAVVVDTDHGPLTVVGTHLNPFSPARRLREARRLVARFVRPHVAGSAGMLLLMGDLNSLDPDSSHERRLADLPLTYRVRHLRKGAGGVPAADTRAVATLARAGLVDLWRAAGSGHRELTVPTAHGGGEFTGMRLDYVLATPAAARHARDCRVVDGAESEYASDHYPVVADLDLTLR